jgi:hypothetical protein
MFFAKSFQDIIVFKFGVLAFLSATQVQGASFMGLGDLPGDIFSSEANGGSATANSCKYFGRCVSRP